MRSSFELGEELGLEVLLPPEMTPGSADHVAQPHTRGAKFHAQFDSFINA